MCGHRKHQGAAAVSKMGADLEVTDPGTGQVVTLPAERIRETLRKLGLTGAKLAVTIRDPVRRNLAYAQALAIAS